jgi:hypothetical protein
MALYFLDHFSLGTRYLYEGCHRLREETGLDNYDGGWFPGTGIANRIVPLPGDVYIEVESIVDQYSAPRGNVIADWFKETLNGGEDHWMFWCLRTATREDLEDVAARFGSSVSSGLGRFHPSGAARQSNRAPREHAPWARGLPNWYFVDDMSMHPSRQPVQHAKPLAAIAWLEVGGSAKDMEEHVGSETFETLPLRFVGQPAGLYGLGLTAESGEEIAIRRPAAASNLEP